MADNDQFHDIPEDVNLPAAGAQPAPVAAVSVKLPEFWSSNPSMWFAQVEASFRRARITVSQTKYDYVFEKLPERVLPSVQDVVAAVNDATPDPYALLKARLCSSFGRNKWQLAYALLDHPDLGDRRPSALMDDMLALLPHGDLADVKFLAMFIRRLPQHMQDHLGTKEFASARAMAEHADLLWDSRGSRPVTAAAVQVAPPARRQSPVGGRRRSPSSNRRSQTPGPAKICWAHRKYGADARTCRLPCGFSGNAPAADGN